MLGKIQGLLKDFWQSRTFQGFTIKYKDFSRLCEPWVSRDKKSASVGQADVLTDFNPTKNLQFYDKKITNVWQP